MVKLHSRSVVLTSLLVALGVSGDFALFACDSSSTDTATSGDAGPRGDATQDVGTDSGGPLDPTLFDSCANDALANDPVFTWQNPDPTKIDVDALKAILNDAAIQQSDAVIIANGDVVIAHKCFTAQTKPQTVQSITKSVVSMAIGSLMADGKITSIDDPVSKYFSEWNTGTRAQVTLKHLLTQTSGLVDEVTDAGTSPLFTADDALAYARTQTPTSAPGTVFNYSNVGVMLLGGIAAQAAGVSLDKYVQDRILLAIGINDATWSKDKAGNAMAPGGLFLTPIDLLRLARLARSGGAWAGDPVVPASWMATITKPQDVVPSYPCYGYLWWVLRDGCDADKGLTGTAGPVQGFYADGYGGNYAAVVPTSKITGVRTKLQTSSDPSVAKAADFSAFTHDLAKLAR